MPPRSSGVLLHVPSLPGGHGIGDLGQDAYQFVDWLAAAGQSLWQILPLGPPGYGNSPYAANSAFCGNADLISLDWLAGDGLLEPSELRHDLPEGRIDYQAVHTFKHAALARAASRFRPNDEFAAFRQRAAYWLPAVLAHGTGPDSPEELLFCQFQFDRQWAALKRYANERQVRIVGDMPIFVADGSIDVRANPALFCLDAQGRPTEVAGVPPDLFSPTGQRWGNPLYDWQAMANDGFRWWSDRIRRSLELVDLLRIDHFRGFAAYWAIPAGMPTAERGQWRQGPGQALFDQVIADLGQLPIVIEDLGLITSDVLDLRDALNLPGMAVLQFAFDGKPDNPYLLHNHVPNSVVYTGTHDNDTTAGWYAALDDATKRAVSRYLGGVADPAWDFIRMAQSSVARMAICPAQDLLSLGSEARLNFPGTVQGNWAWRLRPGAMTAAVAQRLRGVTETFGRLPHAAQQPQVVDGYPFGTAGIDSGR